MTTLNLTSTELALLLDALDAYQQSTMDDLDYQRSVFGTEDREQADAVRTLARIALLKATLIPLWQATHAEFKR